MGGNHRDASSYVAFLATPYNFMVPIKSQYLSLKVGGEVL